MNKQKYIVIVAGGSGKRMGTEIPKQFIVINGLPILMHTINAFYSEDSSSELILVLPDSQHNYWKQLIEKYSFTIKHTLANGGKERFDSVKNGLEFVKEEGFVAIHDGVRPLVSEATIQRCFSKVIEDNAVIPVMPATESIRKIDNEKNVAVDRSAYVMIQTPQVFSTSLLKEAYSQANSNTFTDDASVVEALGKKISLVEGNPENIKITRPMDLKLAEALLKKEF